ncbi:MAG: hypothetical protein FWH28_08485 [Clostridiales bacterium]|nr:hypothetical protein [Clostridiales bacterium]
MKKIITIALVLVLTLVFSAPVLANENQDFTGTPVTVSAPESVLVGESAQIVISVENIADRGLPQLSIWINGEEMAFYEEIHKAETIEFVWDIDTDATGEQTFAISVWTRIGNVNFAAELYAGTVTVNVAAKAITAENIVDAINEAIADAGAANITALVEVANNQSSITLNIFGVEYVFVGGAGVNSDKRCVIDGVTYSITIQANGARFVVR